MRQCSFCGTQRADDVAKCPSCGAKFGAKAKSQGSAESRLRKLRSERTQFTRLNAVTLFVATVLVLAALFGSFRFQSRAAMDIGFRHYGLNFSEEGIDTTKLPTVEVPLYLVVLSSFGLAQKNSDAYINDSLYKIEEISRKIADKNAEKIGKVRTEMSEAVASKDPAQIRKAEQKSEKLSEQMFAAFLRSAYAANINWLKLDMNTNTFHRPSNELITTFTVFNFIAGIVYFILAMAFFVATLMGFLAKKRNDKTVAFPSLLLGFGLGLTALAFAFGLRPGVGMVVSLGLLFLLLLFQTGYRHKYSENPIHTREVVYTVLPGLFTAAALVLISRFVLPDPELYFRNGNSLWAQFLYAAVTIFVGASFSRMLGRLACGKVSRPGVRALYVLSFVASVVVAIVSVQLNVGLNTIFSGGGVWPMTAIASFSTCACLLTAMILVCAINPQKRKKRLSK